MLECGELAVVRAQTVLANSNISKKPRIIVLAQTKNCKIIF